MEYIYLGLLFFGTGLLAIVYYSIILGKEELKSRLPNRVTVRAIVPALLLISIFGVGIWYFASTSGGFLHPSRILLYIFMLLVFESIFLFSLRWVRSNVLAVLLAIGVTGILFFLYSNNQTFILFNSIIIIATLGATTLLIRIGYLRTRILLIITPLWVVYDVLLVRYVLPDVTVIADSPSPSFLFPAVTVGHVSLGSGDFMFLSLFTLVLLRDFGKLPAIVHVVLQGTLFFLIGLVLPEAGFLLPFLVIMAPAFFLVYGFVHYSARKKELPG